MPIEKITVLIGQVALPVFAAVQDEPAELRRYLLRLTEGLALLTFPASFGMALVAPDFVALFLGPKWSGAVLPLQLLAVFVGFRSVIPMFTQILNVTGDSRFSMYNSLLMALVLPASFYLMGVRWGTAGLAITWMTVYPALTLVIVYRRVAQRIALPTRDYLRALWPAASSTIVMCGAVFGAQKLTAGHGSRGTRLGLQVGVGALAYSTVCATVHRHRLRAFYDMIRRHRRP